MKSVAFLLEADDSVGMGHLARCLSLADFCRKRGVRCIFFRFADARQNNAEFYNAARFEWIDVPFKPHDHVEIAAWKGLHEKTGFDALVMDLWEHRCSCVHCLEGSSDFLKVLLSSFPFAHQPVFYDILINMGLLSPAQKQLIKAGGGQARQYAGQEYVIMNDEYVSHALPVEVRKEADTVLVCMGGADPANITLSVLKALAPRPEIKLEVVLGPNYRCRNEILAYKKPGVNFHIGLRSVAPLAQKCDMAIITGGILRYEMALVGLPFIVISTYPVQFELSQVFEDMGAAVNIGTTAAVGEDAILSETKRLLENYEERKNMHNRLTAIVDKKGPERVWRIIHDNVKTPQKGKTGNG